MFIIKRREVVEKKKNIVMHSLRHSHTYIYTFYTSIYSNQGIFMKQGSTLDPSPLVQLISL